jgi:hypothetical protein
MEFLTKVFTHFVSTGILLCIFFLAYTFLKRKADKHVSELFKTENNVLKSFNEFYGRDPNISEMSAILKELKIDKSVSQDTVIQKYANQFPYST